MPEALTADERLLAYLHNGFVVDVTGHPRTIDALKGLLIPNTRVKSISVYGGTPVEKLSSLNYTQLKELRLQ